MIVRDRNHPSVIVWGARLNETPNDAPFYTRTNELAHALDDSRPTVGAMAGLRLTTDYQQDVFGEDDYSAVTDAAGSRRPVLQPPVAGARPYLVSEAVGTLSGPARYYRRTDPQAVQQGQAMAHGRVHDIAASDDRYCGLLAWSGFDYPSGSGNQDQGREVHRRGRSVPGPQARRRHLPGAGRPAGHPGDRARVLLGLRSGVPGHEPAGGDDLHQPRPARGLRGRRALRDPHPRR